MLLYVIAYDIPDDKRRKKTAGLLEGYGQRVQYSVFECLLSSAKYDELLFKLRKVINISEDSVRFYPLSRLNVSNIETWGGVPIITPPNSTIV